eukprot:TRINITY_DN8717_c0_g1_i1.p1 TRINITY_DN8717_c0_g1~~TRINITY_DN8717_c0_g1_i1.p1  ORF type:complete len:187 (+),score=40.24 TRINITY_DN8717_c0_g1_i1:28-561(+)
MKSWLSDITSNIESFTQENRTFSIHPYEQQAKQMHKLHAALSLKGPIIIPATIGLIGLAWYVIKKVTGNILDENTRHATMLTWTQFYPRRFEFDLIDLRERDECNLREGIPGAKNIPLGQFINLCEEGKMDIERDTVFYDEGDVRSMYAIEILKRLKVKYSAKVFYLAGGVKDVDVQ